MCVYYMRCKPKLIRICFLHSRGRRLEFDSTHHSQTGSLTCDKKPGIFMVLRWNYTQGETWRASAIACSKDSALPTDQAAEKAAASIR